MVGTGTHNKLLRRSTVSYYQNNSVVQCNSLIGPVHDPVLGDSFERGKTTRMKAPPAAASAAAALNGFICTRIIIRNVSRHFIAACLLALKPSRLTAVSNVPSPPPPR